MTRTFRADDGNDYKISPVALGRGSQGTVYRGRRCSDDTDVAIKLILDGAARGPATNRELQIALRLGRQKPPPRHLLAPCTWAIDGNDLLLVMPLADRSLTEELAEHPAGLHEEAVRHILRHITTGLVELDSTKIVHRDIKPSNLLLYQGRWHISDFGISRDLDMRTATETFPYGGTLLYSAPERWEGSPATYKSDLYALGCIGHQLATGSPPFTGPDVAQLRHQHLHTHPPATPVSPALARWILRLLRKNPWRRHQGAKDAFAALPTGPIPQGPLAEAALQHERRRQQQAAAQSQAVTAADAVAAERQQALADLEDICASATELAQQDLPDLKWESHGGIQRFSVDEIRLDFILWHPREGHERLILVGEVATLVDDQRRCSANVVCERAADRQQWYIDTFTRNARTGIVEPPVGFSDEQAFFTHYRSLHNGGIHTWERQRRPLSPNVIVEILTKLLLEA